MQCDWCYVAYTVSCMLNALNVNKVKSSVISIQMVISLSKLYEGKSSGLERSACFYVRRKQTESWQHTYAAAVSANTAMPATAPYLLPPQHTFHLQNNKAFVMNVFTVTPSA